MFYLITAFVLLFSSYSFANQAMGENDPAVFVEGVNVITGDLCLHEEDLVVAGVQPIRLSRHYVSQKGKGYWEIFPYHIIFLLENSSPINESFIEITEPSGSVMLYERPGNEHYFYPKIQDWKGVTNTAKGSPSGRHNLKNQRVHYNRGNKYLDVLCPNGTKRVYKKIQKSVESKLDDNEFEIGSRKIYFHIDEIFDRGPKILSEYTHRFLLVEEYLPNGNKIVYEWPKKKDAVWQIKSCNAQETITYAWIKFYPKKGKNGRSHGDYGIETSDQRHLELFYFSHNDKHYLKKVASDEKPNEEIQYEDFYSGRSKHPKLQVNAICTPHHRSFFVNYYKAEEVGGKSQVCRRVKSIVRTLSEQNEKAEVAKFLYDVDAKKTIVLDAKETPTIYYWNDDLRLIKVERFLEPGCLYNCEKFYWGGKGSQDETNLLCKLLFDEKQILVKAERLFYDGWGNCIERRLYGNLTGDGTIWLDNEGLPEGQYHSIFYRYSQDGKNLLTEKTEEEGATVCYSYLPDTDLIAEEKIYDQNRLIQVHSYCYDGNKNQIAIHVQDQNKTPYHSTLIHRKSDKEDYPSMPSCLEEKGKEGLIQKTYLHYTVGGRISQKDIFDSQNVFRYSLTYRYVKGCLTKETNALGYEAVSEYDIFGNKIRFCDFDGRCTHTFGYDAFNRLRWHTRSFDGIDLHTNYQYNWLHQKIQEWDEDYNSTEYQYDPFDNVTEVHLPSGGIITSSYNCQGAEITRKDARGFITTTSYNCQNKPLCIQYPDGSCESFSYYKNGNLKSHKNTEGLETLYTYDGLSRILTKKTPFTLETFSYDSFHLTEEIDTLGYKTYYEYDAKGRKTKEDKEGSVTTYLYNFLGDLFQTRKEDLVVTTLRDNLGRVKEERKEDQEGNWLEKTSYNYDKANNLIESSCYIEYQESKTLFAYDGLGRLIKKTDPLNGDTTYCYSHAPFTKTEIDPQGLIITTTYNAAKKPIRMEKRFQDTFFAEDYFYDYNDNLIRKDTYNPHQTILLDYDPVNRLCHLIEGAYSPDEKTTSYTYTPSGLLATITKKDGPVLTNTYNLLGHLIHQESSDQSICYTNSYDTAGHLLHSLDEITQQEIVRTYNEQGNLVSETFPNNLNLHRTYDKQGRCRLCTLPDHSTVFYDYRSFHLTQVSWGPYTHRYLERDLSGRIVQEELACHAGLLLRHYDLMGRPISLQSQHYQEQNACYDSIGNLVSVQKQNQTLCYNYDALSHLIQEPGHTYTLDGLANRICQDGHSIRINALNQTEELDYDPRGNPRSFAGKTLVFDALDRLIIVQDQEKKICYTYDFLGRRLSKQIEDAKTFYFYDEFDEIGSATGGSIEEIRILGNRSHAEIGAAVLMQLQGQIYIPIHDLQGNIACLENLDGSYELYTYTAFGQELFTKATSPWRFSSKRTDEETGFSYFGRRYYIPSLGRWLSQDPLGILESPNLYAFVSGCPLTHFDLYGLLDEGSWYQQPRVQAALQVWGGAVEMSLGVGTTYASGGMAFCFGAMMFTHGVDSILTGLCTLVSGIPQETAIVSSLQQTGLSAQTALSIDAALGAPTFFYGNNLKALSTITTKSAPLPDLLQVAKQTSLTKTSLPLKKTPIPTKNNCSRLYREAYPCPQGNMDVHHVFPQKFNRPFFVKKGINIHESKYLTYWERSSHRQAAWGYNEKWREFIHRNPDTTISQILEFGKSMMIKEKIHVNY